MLEEGWGMIQGWWSCDGEQSEMVKCDIWYITSADFCVILEAKVWPAKQSQWGCLSYTYVRTYIIKTGPIIVNILQVIYVYAYICKYSE